jgi:5S rRNA maturation endonuclease (ribonuclease M5)
MVGETAPFDVICDFFELSGDEDGEISVRCPFHGDTSASASINVSRGKFNCHACDKAFSSFPALADALLSQDLELPTFVPEPAPILEPEDVDALDELAFVYLNKRGVPDDVLGIEFEVEQDPSQPLAGYLIMRTAKYGDRFVARNLMNNANPKYYNSPGNKGLFFLDTYSVDDDHVWLVEGIFDALSLAALGIGQVAAVLGSKVKPEDLYSVRHQTVFLLFDNDWPGYSGARKTAKQLQEMGGNPVVVNLERRIGQDPNDAHVTNPELFQSWLLAQVVDYAKNDIGYIERFLTNTSPLQLIPSTLPVLDSLLGGGFKDGVAIIGAEPGVGKTSFATWFSAIAATRQAKRVLYVTYEISKRQVWSRLAAIASGTTWDALELDPNRITTAEREWVRRLSKVIRVAVGWNVNKIKYVIDDYDVVVVDYLQRMPGKPGEDNEEKTNVSFNVRELSNLARDKQKVIFAISSLNRVGYGKMNLSIFKDSGDIEYAVQVAIALIRHVGPTDGEDKIIDCHLIKNTRGREGLVFLRSDLGHQRFEEAEPHQGEYREPIGN